VRHRHDFEPQLICPTIHHRLHGLRYLKHGDHLATDGAAFTEQNVSRET
jgi:hypothetical protein